MTLIKKFLVWCSLPLAPWAIEVTIAVSSEITGSTSSRIELARTFVAAFASPTGAGVSSSSGAGVPTADMEVRSGSLAFCNRLEVCFGGAGAVCPLAASPFD